MENEKLEPWALMASGSTASTLGIVGMPARRLRITTGDTPYTQEPQSIDLEALGGPLATVTGECNIKGIGLSRGISVSIGFE